MRCPKCGFISFDDMETCSGCKASLRSPGDVIKAAVFHVAAPFFLKFSAQQNKQQARVDTASADADAPLFGESATEDEGIAFDFDESQAMVTPPDLPSGDTLVLEDETLVFSGNEEDGEAAALALDEAAPAVEEKKSVDEEISPQLDFAGLDLSDLGPPESESQPWQEDVPAEPELALAFDAPATSTASLSPLEDLQVDDLDFAGPLQPVRGSATGKKLLPGVKTGTALDDFDPDLGELFPES